MTKVFINKPGRATDYVYTVSQKNRTLEKFSNISKKAGPISIIFGTENRQ